MRFDYWVTDENKTWEGICEAVSEAQAKDRALVDYIYRVSAMRPNHPSFKIRKAVVGRMCKVVVKITPSCYAYYRTLTDKVQSNSALSTYEQKAWAEFQNYFKSKR